MKYEFKWWEVVLLKFVKMKYSLELIDNRLTEIGYKKLFGTTYVLEENTEILKDIK